MLHLPANIKLIMYRLTRSNETNNHSCTGSTSVSNPGTTVIEQHLQERKTTCDTLPSVVPLLEHRNKSYSKRRNTISRTWSFRRSIGKAILHFSRDRSSNCSTYTMLPHTSTQEIFSGFAELSGDRDECELPADPSLTYTNHYVHRTQQPTMTDTPAWQNIRDSQRNRKDLVNATAATFSNTSQRTVIPIDTSMIPIRARPSVGPHHYVSPVMNSKHSSMESHYPHAMLFSPQSAISPVSSQTSTPGSQLCSGSEISSNETFHTGSCGGNPHNLIPYHLENRSPYLDTSFDPSSYSQDLDNSKLPISSVSPVSHQQVLDSWHNFQDEGNGISVPTTSQSYQLSGLHCNSSDVLHDSVSTAYQLTPAYSQYPHAARQFDQRTYYLEDDYEVAAPRYTVIEDQLSYPNTYHGSTYVPVQDSEVLPSYEQSQATTALPGDYEAIAVPAQRAQRTQRRGIKRSTARVAEKIVRSLSPVSCLHCPTLFNGEYKKGNLKRHVKDFHTHPEHESDGIDQGRICGTCGARFARTDARKKHEWKKHRKLDCKPKKRRIEKKNGERRIYMPGMEAGAENEPLNNRF